jgi:hypothetical protein
LAAETVLAAFTPAGSKTARLYDPKVAVEADPASRLRSTAETVRRGSAALRCDGAQTLLAVLIAVAKVRIVVEALLACIPLRADTGAGVARALGSFGAGIRINELWKVIGPSQAVTWQTKV